MKYLTAAITLMVLSGCAAQIKTSPMTSPGNFVFLTYELTDFEGINKNSYEKAVTEANLICAPKQPKLITAEQIEKNFRYTNNGRKIFIDSRPYMSLMFDCQ